MSVKYFFVVFSSLSWLSCVSSDPKSSPQSQLSPEEQKRFDELKSETDIGRNMAGRLLAYYGNLDSEELRQYLNRLGTFLGGYSDHPDRRYMIEVIDTDIVNAFACPGGYILITKGAILHAQNEAELAAVIAHEIAHVGFKHMFNTLQKMDKEELDKAAEDGKGLAELPESVMVRKRPDPATSEAGALIARYLSGSAAGLNALQAARAGMSVILEKGLDIEKEFEADEFGIKYSVRAGYDPLALEDYLCRLESKSSKPGRCRMDLKAAAAAKKKDQSILAKTHPPIPKRVKHIRKVLKEIQAGEMVGALGKKRFEKYKKLAAKS